MSRSASSKGPYKTKRPKRDFSRFAGQADKHDQDGSRRGKRISLPICAHFDALMTDLARCLQMNATEVLWFSVLYSLERLLDINCAYTALEIREQAEQPFSLSDTRRKTLRYGPAAKTRVEALRLGLELPTTTATFRFAVQHAHGRMDVILKWGVDNAITQNPYRALVEHERETLQVVKSFDPPSRDQKVAALVLGKDFKKKLGHCFPDATEEEIRDALVDMIREETRLTLRAHAAAKPLEEWEARTGITEVKHLIAELDRRLSEYVAARRRYGTTQSFQNTRKMLVQNLTRMRRALEKHIRQNRANPGHF